MMSTFLIYGANGYTGELIAREAKARGQAPILAGRSASAVQTLARELGLSHRVFDLDDPSAVDAGLAGVSLVLNCAGPFARTAKPMADGCLRRGVHYLDVTGEVSVFESLAARDADAKAAGVMLLPGCGFDVVPTDCLAAHMKRRLPSATHLALGFQALGRLSRGTAITTIENIGRPNLVRRNGVLTEVPMGASTRTIDFGLGPTSAVSIPWGDVSTAYYSTGIPNIEVFVSQPRVMQLAMKWNQPLAPILQSSVVQNFLKNRVRAGAAGPSAEARARGRSYVWAEARDGAQVVTSHMQTPEGYQLTMLTALAAADKVLKGTLQPGFQTPSRVFGSDFILEIPGTSRRDD